MGVVIEKASKVYSCCGQYFATTKACTDSKVKCPRCGQVLSGALRTPSIQIVKKS